MRCYHMLYCIIACSILLCYPVVYSMFLLHADVERAAVCVRAHTESQEEKKCICIASGRAVVRTRLQTEAFQLYRVSVHYIILHPMRLHVT